MNKFKFKIGDRVITETGVRGTVVQRYRHSKDPKIAHTGVIGGAKMYVVNADHPIDCPALSSLGISIFTRAELAFTAIQPWS